MNIILAFDYKLNDIVKMDMEGLAMVDIDTMSSKTLNAGKIITQGPLLLNQPNLLQMGKRHQHYNDKYFD